MTQSEVSDKMGLFHTKISCTEVGTNPAIVDEDVVEKAHSRAFAIESARKYKLAI
jgi:hypothetical protein